MQDETTLVLVAWLLAALVGAGGFLARWRRGRAWHDRLKKLPRTLLRDQPLGEVKIVGKIRLLGPPLVAPLSGRECCAYRFTVIEPDPESADKVLVNETKHQDFLVVDDTGQAVVRMSLSEPVLDLDCTERQTLFGRKPALGALLEARGINTHYDSIPRHLKGDEGVLEEGETVVVCGVGKHEVDPDPASVASYRDGTPTRYVVHGTEAMAMLVSDDVTLVRLGRRHQSRVS